MPGGNKNCTKWQLIYRRERGNIWGSILSSHLIRIIDSFRKQKVSRDKFLRSLVSHKWLAIAAHYFYTKTSLVISPSNLWAVSNVFRKHTRTGMELISPWQRSLSLRSQKWKLSVSLTHCTDVPAPTSEMQGRASTFCSPDIQIRSRWQGKKMNRILNWLYFIIWYWLETTRKLFAMSIVPFPEVKHNIWNEAIKSP